jgi:predicted esterase
MNDVLIKSRKFLTTYLFAVFSCGVGSAQATVMPEFKTVCAGSVTPKHRVIFLQGIIIEGQEIDYVALLDKVGKELGVKFAIPYSNVYCKNSQTAYCWGTEEPDSVARVYEDIQRSASTCFSLKHEWGLLGFSNGGYHVGRVIAQGRTPLPKWAMAIGSAGTLQSSTLDRLPKRTPFYLESGTEDRVREDAHRFFLELKNHDFNVKYGEYSGKHELTEETLRDLLGKVL